MKKCALLGAVSGLIMVVGATGAVAHQGSHTQYREYEAIADYFIKKHPEAAIEKALDAIRARDLENHVASQLNGKLRSSKEHRQRFRGKSGEGLKARLDEIIGKLDALAEHPLNHGYASAPEAFLETGVEPQDAVLLNDQEAAQTDADAEGGEWFHVASSLVAADALPLVGNDDGQVTLAYFYDYNCLPCAEIDADLQAIAASFDDVRLVFRDLTRPDDIRARIALGTAQVAPESFPTIHQQMYRTSYDASPEELMAVLTDLLGDEHAQAVWQVATHVEEDDLITQELHHNRLLGEALDFDEIPRVYVNGAEAVFVGSASLDEVRAHLESTVQHQPREEVE